MTSHPETVETSQWDNRELLLRIYYQTVETNGSVRMHDRTLYGDTIHGVIGLVQQACENGAYLERMKVGLRIAFTIAGACVTILTAILVMLVEHVL